MTERERYTTRAGFYLMTGDYPQCVKEYGDLLALYAADVAAHNNLAICSIYLRDIRKALDEMRRVVAILPQRALYRVNLALYSNYAGEFQAAEQEARTIQEPNVKALLALAFAQLGQGQLPQAMATYQKLETIDALGASFAASGLGDLAMLEGRFSDAARILEQGAARDLTSKNADRAASKFAALAHAELLRGRTRAAIAAAEQALANSNAVKIRFLAARSFVEAGEADRARPLIAGLASELQAEPQAYAKIVEGRTRAEEWRPAPGDQSSHRGEHAARHLGGPFRSRSRLLGGGCVHAGRFRVRPLHRRAGARRCHCSWTRNPPTRIWRPSTTTRAVSGKG